MKIKVLKRIWRTFNFGGSFKSNIAEDLSVFKEPGNNLFIHVCCSGEQFYVQFR